MESGGHIRKAAGAVALTMLLLVQLMAAPTVIMAARTLHHAEPGGGYHPRHILKHDCEGVCQSLWEAHPVVNPVLSYRGSRISLVADALINFA